MAHAKVYPITLHPRFELLTEVGQFTSACGITFYRGSLFVAEQHDLVHQDLLTDSKAPSPGASSKWSLASTDSVVPAGKFLPDRMARCTLWIFIARLSSILEWMSTEAQKSKRSDERHRSRPHLSHHS